MSQSYGDAVLIHEGRTVVQNTVYVNILCAGYHISDMNADIKNNNENIMRILIEMEVVNSATRASKFEWYSNGCHNCHSVVPISNFQHIYGRI